MKQGSLVLTPGETEKPSRLKSTLSERNRERPAHVRDFDSHYGLHNLQDARDTPGRREWVTPLWQNLVALAFVAMIVGSCLTVWHFNPEARMRPDSPLLSLALGATVVFLVFALWILGAMMLHRGRLVLDYNARHLRFYRSLLWPREVARLSLDEIRVLTTRKITVPDANVDSTPWTYKIVVAELRDGRLVSIAFDSPSVVSAIHNAVNS